MSCESTEVSFLKRIVMPPAVLVVDRYPGMQSVRREKRQGKVGDT